MHDVIRGDSAVVLGHFPEAHFHGIVTDPPHGLAFMGAEWDKALPAQPIWDECFRVLKPGGHAWVISSDRMSTTVGFYLGLQRAGFAIERYQTLHWLQLQGMPKSSDIAKTADKEAFRAWLEFVGRETVACPDHKEEKDAEGKPKRCAACEGVFAEGKLTQHDRRKAESAAVNGAGGMYREREAGDGRQYPRKSEEAASAFGNEFAKEPENALLTSLLSSHWPASPSEQRAQWEAVIGEVPEGWDCSRPPGVRVKIGRREFERSPFGERRWWNVSGTGGWYSSITAPSTPDAAEWDGWRGSVAPFHPMVSDILHAQKPWKGTYLDCARKHGTGSLNLEEGRIPFGTKDSDGTWGSRNIGDRSEDIIFPGKEAPSVRNEAGRVPGNLLTYADLLGSLTHQADLDAWAERCGLPKAGAELLEAGIVYAPKPGKKEKEAGLDGFEGKLPIRSPMNSSLRKCANCGKWIGNESYRRHRPNACACAKPEPTEYVGLLPRKNNHITVKPVSLCAFLVALSTREGDRVLDPFCGSGTQGVACKMLGRGFVGIDLDASFCEIARARIEATEPVKQPEKQPALELAGE